MKADRININSTEEIIAEKLLKIGAVFLRPDDPFTWASGIKSPIYCDNRLILSAPKVRNVVEEAMAMAIDESFPECEVIMDMDLRNKLIAAKDESEFIAAIDEAEKAKYPDEAGSNEVVDAAEGAGEDEGYKILAVTACPTGIAHTYMTFLSMKTALQ